MECCGQVECPTLVSLVLNIQVDHPWYPSLVLAWLTLKSTWVALPLSCLCVDQVLVRVLWLVLGVIIIRRHCMVHLGGVVNLSSVSV